MNGGPHKIHVKYDPTQEEWHVRYGNLRLRTKHIISFISLTSFDGGALAGAGVVEEYGPTTLVLNEAPLD